MTKDLALDITLLLEKMRSFGGAKSKMLWPNQVKRQSLEPWP